MTDIVTVDDAAGYLGTADTHDVALARLVTAVSERIDQMCGPVINRAVTERHNGGHPSLVLADYPIVAVTSITEWAGTTETVLAAETDLVKPASGYLHDPDTGIVYRRSGGADACFPIGRRNIEVVYTAGRGAIAPAKFAEAALLTIAHYWRRERSSSSSIDSLVEDSFGAVYFLPRAALEMLGEDLREPVVA